MISATPEESAVMLNVGCGTVYFDAWVNIDNESEKADLKLDVRNEFPFEDDSVNFIYNEHFIEHLNIHEAVEVLSNFHRVLKKNGVVRIATGDLDYLVQRYLFAWKKQDWIHRYGYDWIQTRAEMLNICFKEWGHQYLYNREELTRRLRQAGFQKIYKQMIGRSRYGEFVNRETRRDSRLILEAVK